MNGIHALRLASPEHDDACGTRASAPRTTIVLAELPGVVTTAVRRVLEADPEFAVVAEASDLETAVRKVLGYKPVVAVLDENIGAGELPAALPRFTSASPESGIVLLTEEDDPQFARLFMRAGGRGLVLKRAPSSYLTDAVRAVAQGQRYLHPQVGGRVATELEGRTPYGDDLTEREVEVMKFVALGYTTAEIADRLTLSVRTVEAHRTHLRRKIHAESRAGVIAYARACRVV